MDRLARNLKRILYSPWLPWSLVGVTLFITLLHEIIQPSWIASLPSGSQAALWALALLGIVAAYLVFSRYSDLSDKRARLEADLAEAYQRLEAIFQMNQNFVQANDEIEVIRPLLRVLASLTGAQNAVFVPFDEHGQPQAALSHRELPSLVMESWAEYLASPPVRAACSTCNRLAASGSPSGCPLLTGPFQDAESSFCLPVRRGEREFGVASLLFSSPIDLDARTRAFLHALVDEVSLGLEGVQLRRRELDALRRSQVLRYKADLKALLSGLLENILSALDADFAILVVPQLGSFQSRIDLVIGDFPPAARLFADGVIQGVIASGEPVLIGDVAGGPGSSPGLHSLLSAPLFSAEHSVVGAVLVGNYRMKGFHQRQIALLQAITGQVALVVQNAALMAELEYKTLIQERVRLAREIHDGLAQTIGFLKLQAAQLRNHLAHNELERARQNAELFYATLTEAYQDARQVIDGLRISPAESGLNQWIEQTLSEFQEISGLVVELEAAPTRTNLPLEIHAQLIRILQEALSNVRKHARAKQVWVTLQETEAQLILEVRDDGEGFCLEELTRASKHGLQGMQERAELIGADLQVISQPRKGALVRLRLPLERLEELVQ